MSNFAASLAELPRSALMYSDKFMAASLGLPKPPVNSFLNGDVYHSLDMDNHRKTRLAALIASRYKGNRADLIAASGLSKGRISQLLGPGQPFKENAARSLEESLGLKRGYFDEKAVENTAPAPPFQGAVPLISWITAGNWAEASDPLQPGDAQEWLPCMRAHSDKAFALRVRGDSMTAPHGRSYPEGCIVFVDPELRSPDNGARVIAKMNGTDEVTFKVYKEEDGRRWLQPLNPAHLPIRDEFRVLGTVIGKWEDE